MCAPCEAAKERLEAAKALRHAAEANALSVALKSAFKPHPIPDEMWALINKL